MGVVELSVGFRSVGLHSRQLDILDGLRPHTRRCAMTMLVVHKLRCAAACQVMVLDPRPAGTNSLSQSQILADTLFL